MSGGGALWRGLSGSHGILLVGESRIITIVLREFHVDSGKVRN